MYESKLAAAVKVKGRVLREFKDTVKIPFGSEYSILLKNLNTTRALINVFIDGENQVPGGLVLNAGQEIDLERSIKNGNLKTGNRFKFIERTDTVEQHRGIGIEDGIVRIEFQFERPVPVYRPPYQPQTNPWDPIYPVGGIVRGSDIRYGTGTAGSVNCSTVSATSAYVNQVNDAGITVAGSKSDQTFTTAYMGLLEDQKYSMVFKLLGGEAVREAITVKHKPKCTTCGKQNKATAKFCTECGTHLEIFA